MYDNLTKLIFELCKADGTSGDEREIADIACRQLNKYIKTDIDKNGNVTGSLNPQMGNPMLLDAHIDKIGLITLGIEDNGFLRVDKCGGVDLRVLASQEVIIHGKKDIYGVITCAVPHLTKKGDEKKANEIEDVFVDTGLSKAVLEEYVEIGTRITFKTKQVQLINGVISSAALDNRVGVVAIIRCIEILCNKTSSLNRRVDILLSAQEETGGTGAVTGSYNSKARECICTDVTFAAVSDVPQELHGKIGSGPMIGFAPSLDYKMSTVLKELAQNADIPYQVEVMGGKSGTNADNICISKGGIKCSLISIPQRNMHTCVETVCIEDVENTARLMAEYILKGGACNA